MTLANSLQVTLPNHKTRNQCTIVQRPFVFDMMSSMTTKCLGETQTWQKLTIRLCPQRHKSIQAPLFSHITSATEICKNVFIAKRGAERQCSWPSHPMRFQSSHPAEFHIEVYMQFRGLKKVCFAKMTAFQCLYHWSVTNFQKKADNVLAKTTRVIRL